ncbi:hypothetical protein GWK47_012400 [Chionoecetes opilio]|uniref:Uncharacterized protein n=1 Tax=Chionoecetes opilio TaxID=41210 RepID=A0A8J4XWW4_CHIOP|nr:hypothetical protein GWK47_012400 [Chionoecetes opilio]
MGTWTPSSNRESPYPPSLAKEGSCDKGRSPSHHFWAPKRKKPSGSFMLEAMVLLWYTPSQGGDTTFDDFASGVFVPPHEATGTSMRVDLVWGRSWTTVSKKSTREKRGKGVEGKGGGQPRSQQIWAPFPRAPKQGELFPFLSKRFLSTTFPQRKAGLCNIWGPCSLQWD